MEKIKGNGKNGTNGKLSIASGELHALIGITEYEARKMTLKGVLPARHGDGWQKYYDVLEVIKSLYIAISTIGEDVEGAIRQERLRELQIKNALREGAVIDREEVKQRVLATFEAVKSLIKLSIKNAAPLLVGCNSPTRVEEILRVQYTNALKQLETEAVFKDW